MLLTSYRNVYKPWGRQFLMVRKKMEMSQIRIRSRARTI
jgi:hypothetical protein